MEIQHCIANEHLLPNRIFSLGATDGFRGDRRQEMGGGKLEKFSKGAFSPSPLPASLPKRKLFKTT